MSLFTRWLGKNDPEDYEQVLSSLALDIQKRQTRLSEIRLRERRSTLLVTLYTLAIWALYVSLWYMGVLSAPSGPQEKALKGIPVILGPIIILFTRRIVQLWYNQKGNAEEKTLKNALQKQRVKIEEIKKKTNYYSTRNLIEKYDDAASPMRRRNGPQPPSTPISTTPQTLPKQPLPNAPTQSPNPLLQSQLSPSPQPVFTPRKQWYDKLADAILGDDEQSATFAASRYALICEKCFHHNGLVKESLWQDTQYVCPKCGHFNASARSKREGLSRTPSPTSSPVGQSPPQDPSRLKAPRRSVGSRNVSPGNSPDSNGRLTTSHGDVSVEEEVDGTSTMSMEVDQ
ncbi:hypothetical protein SERLA73DRAFT_178217 [Serpula lacrymans var. lacrymans S7.3]|uniref:Endoplasmic reticulum junction formation protein lunapark n=2 Tax=Serpula lacrymans var. lacrymans TaxID=341189 RepID=F8PR43_SERL3|nr:uncharacterized protein SERLADRAFT_462522 [Serpula lacrymans var. lacrymans S7.9]EGO02334.1 hypothetical protein SERLA73DRAFT_178217 [Serpula lacrymans var. lacrymans S7.3]EGO28068.1 hypothetical protein SERLADRAFT_462522 [Serpula lacrymans var. lacrymans S7.9]